MEEKVDILLATYKPNITYLKEQIESILNQTHKNIKLYISDDYSNEQEVIETLETYAKKDDRIELYVQEKNLGYIKNFEFLLTKSTAKYVAFCDQDDIWYPNKIEKSLNTLIEKNVDLIYCNSKHINENDEIISRYLGLGCSQIFTSEVRQKMLPYKESVMAHDWLASFIASEGKGVDYIEEPLFSYRLHTSNVFGGRSLNQNISRWKQEHGKSYQSYLQYRNEKVIDKAYLDGAKMCLEYSTNSENIEKIKQLIKYYEKLKKVKYINFQVGKYMKFLSGKNMLKKMIKELIIFHLPLLGYVVYILQK